MKHTAKIISIYASDTSGVCSMLYELGGLVVVHDASGCNSTYSTHDEPRWYHQDSMIYISALTEMDAILGNDARFVEDLVRAAEELSPRFIAICGSPMPMMIGTDFDALASEVESRTGLPVFGLHTNGMNSYLAGASQALCAYLQRFCTAGSPQKRRVNLIGATPLDFSLNGTVESICDWLQRNGFIVNSCMAMGSSPEAISAAGNAGVNLVISGCGRAAAEWLRQTFGTPWVEGVPFGQQFAEDLLKRLEIAERENRCIPLPASGFSGEKGTVCVVGEELTACSFARALELELQRPVRALIPQALSSGRHSLNDLIVPCEDSMAEAFAESEWIIADPLYEPLIPAGAAFRRYPHEAFSGRCFSSGIPNLICRSIKQEFSL